MVLKSKLSCPLLDSPYSIVVLASSAEDQLLIGSEAGTVLHTIYQRDIRNKPEAMEKSNDKIIERLLHSGEKVSGNSLHYSEKILPSIIL